MEVTVLKTDKWAFKGIHIKDIKEGKQEMNNDLANELIKAGWAELPKEEKIVIEKEVIDPIVKKEKSGWWSVTFAGHEEIKVRGADDEEEAIVLATAKLEVK